jgi:hypothetical protein
MRWHWAAGLTGAALWFGQLSLLAFPSGIRQAFASADEKPPASNAPQAPPEKASEKSVAKTAKEIRDEQLSISGRYARFERMLVQMADILGRQDPERADVIRRALGKGREDLLKDDIEAIVQMLEQGQLGDAALKQGEVVKSFQDLLVLLQSEDRRSSVERERERLNGLLKNVRNLLNEQRSARAATQNSRAPSDAAPGQQRALDGTQKTLEDIRQHDQQKAGEGQKEKSGEAKEEGGEGKGSDSQKDKDTESEGKSGQKGKEAQQNKAAKGGQGDGQKQSDEQDDRQDKQSKDDKQGSKDKNSNGQKSEKSGKSAKQGQQGSSGKSGKSSNDQKSGGSESTPGREQLERAQEQMEQALEALREQQREQALKNEDKAIEELQEAAEELEKELKQLREEEKEMVLASLEARFQRMLLVQTEIHEGTKVLAGIPKADWLDLNFGRCRELAQQQLELARECGRTVLLLREDGSAAAILLAVEDIEEDMNSVSGWLQGSDVSELTLSVQQDILESLRQLIETTQKELKNMQDSNRPPQPSQPGSQQQRLVELMAEIRVLRNLQMQVNRRTKQVDGLVPNADANALPRLQQQIKDLADRQQRLLETAKELAKQAE